ncbi:MAG: hypothetical protein GY711_11425 [bacterium]|nr:hypothetical protein [bacterium]
MTVRAFDVEVVADLGGFDHFMDGLRRKQVPFATALALTRTAQDAQAAAKRRMQKVFTLRSKWAEGGVRIRRAEKRDWPNTRAVVGHLDAMFVLHETGGIRRPRSGHRFAIPTRAVRRTKTGKISKARRPSHVIASGAFVEGRRIRRKTRRSTKASTQANRLTTLYFLRRQVRIRARLRFRVMVEHEANRVLGTHFESELRKAIKTARVQRFLRATEHVVGRGRSQLLGAGGRLL